MNADDNEANVAFSESIHIALSLEDVNENIHSDSASSNENRRHDIIPAFNNKKLICTLN